MTPEEEAQVDRLSDITNDVLKSLFDLGLDLPEIGAVLNLAAGKFIAGVAADDDMFEEGLKMTMKNVEKTARFYYERFKKGEGR